MASRLRKSICGCAMGSVAGSVAVGVLSLAVPARGNIILYTTTSDFTGWSAGADAYQSSTPHDNTVTATASTAYDYDGSTTNGLSNSAVGGTSTAGSLALTDTETSVPGNTLGYSVLASSPRFDYNAAMMQAIDPGSTASYSAATSYGPGSTVAYSGTLLLTYTVPASSAGSYFNIGVNLDYSPAYYQAVFGTSVSDGTVDGLSTYTATIPYTISAGSLSYFALGIQSNSNYVPTSPFYVDSIQLVTAVPEPASALVVFGAAGYSLLARRRRSV